MKGKIYVRVIEGIKDVTREIDTAHLLGVEFKTTDGAVFSVRFINLIDGTQELEISGENTNLAVEPRSWNQVQIGRPRNVMRANTAQELS